MKMRLLRKHRILKESRLKEDENPYSPGSHGKAESDKLGGSSQKKISENSRTFFSSTVPRRVFLETRTRKTSTENC
jgi:hypothetical protein